MVLPTILLNVFASIALISAVMVIISTNPIHSVVFLILVFCNAAGLLILLKMEFIAMMFLIIYVGAIAVLFLFVVMMLNIKVNELSENWLRYLPIGGIISLIFLLEIGLFLISPLERDFVPFLFQGVSAQNMDFNTFYDIYLANYRNTCIISDGGNTSFCNSQNSLLSISQNVIIFHNFLQETYQNIFICTDMSDSSNVELRNWSSLLYILTNIQSLGFLIYTYYFYYFLMASLILLIAMIGAIVLTMHKRKNASKKQFIYKQIARNFESAVAYSST